MILLPSFSSSQIHIHIHTILTYFNLLFQNISTYYSISITPYPYTSIDTNQFTRFVLTGVLGYLLFQAGAIFKLTFFSRFGWDVMEPITYFITFGTGLFGYIFFTYNKLEYSYPAFAALITRRKAEKLYKSAGFDFQEYMDLKNEAEMLRQQLDAIVPPKPLMNRAGELSFTQDPVE